MSQFGQERPFSTRKLNLFARRLQLGLQTFGYRP